MTIGEINSMPISQFVEKLGWIFEHSPWVAERAWGAQPFASLEALHAAMETAVEQASESEQLALLCAHPDLGTRAQISEASATEQLGAGLDRLTPDEYDQVLSLNTAYKQKFGFPFLYAVKGTTKYQILEALERRLNSSPEDEFREALLQVSRIAMFRLRDTVED